ncbi:uncharacterized protein [Rhodnius prolixus]
MNKVEEPTGSRTMQALDYYNSNVLRSKVSSALRSSCNDRQGGGGLDHCHYSSHHRRTHDSLYRSNSSLELMHDQHILLSNSGGNGVGLKPNTPVLRREYGSHGSIDVIASSDRSYAAAESLIDMFAEYSKPGGNKDSTSSLIEDEKATSPKVRLKLGRFWGSSSGGGGSGSGATGGGTNAGGSGSGKQQRQGSVEEALLVAASSNTTTSHHNEEERQRRRAFAHYDCRSVTANLGYAAKVRSILLSKRRNTTTGASAASTLGVRSSTPDGGDSGDEDHGDGNCNSLVESCPYFRNELGGEEERVIGLMRGTRSVNGKLRPHRPALACGLSVLEFPLGQSHWTHGPVCPYGQTPRPIESVDHGALYYRKYFYQQEHQNWFGMDDNLGPVAISIRRERAEKPPNSSTSTGNSNASTHLYRYRLLIRTSELLTLRGSVLEDAIPNLKPASSSKALNTKEVLEYASPEVQISCLRLGIGGAATEEALLKLDEQGLSRHYKVGIMYCKAGQSTEEQMYNNQEVGPALTEFLDTIGTTVRLKGFEQYKAGLDNKTDSTGLYSVYSQYQDCEIMFHVSTMLPFTPNNRQQLLRKRHIGNDIVTIVFQEPGAHPFTPKVIRSQFQHVFIVVRAISPCTENTRYSIAVARSKEVPIFGPPIPENATFPKSKAFADFLLAKIINGENAAHQSEKFATMATRTRQEYLKDLVSNYTTATVVEPNQKFSMLSFSSKKKTERWRPRFVPGDAVTQSGAIVWQVIVDDCGLSHQLDAFLAISADSIVIIEEATREIVFVTSCKSVLGWSANANSLRLYFHQGECITFHMREGGERDELMEVVVRLRAVTNGSVAQEFSLKRNPLGQLGFHVQPDGVVTQVENMGLAYMAGLRQGARLVEICKVAVSTLSHDQMVDLLKTSVAVTVTVIPPLADGTPRRGCSLQNCKYNTTYEGDYENVNNNSNDTTSKANSKTARQQAVTGNVRKRYERSFSPPRSSNSSGYGTGSSSKSSASVDRFANIEGTLTSSSSGHSLDDRWYEVLESGVEGGEGTSPPPPLPVRLNNPYIHPAHPTNSHSKMNGYSMLEPSQHEFKVGEKVTCLIKAERSHELRRQIERNHSDYHLNQVEYGHYQLTTSSSVDEKTLQDSASNISRPQSDGGHSTDTSSTSDRMFGLPSEDDLSGGKGSPVVRRNKSHNKEATGQQQQARLRQIPRSQRNSANLQSSTFQQDLLRLIHPDYMEPNDLQAISTSSLKETYGKITGNSGGSLSNLTSDSSTTTLCSDVNIEINKSRPHSPPTKDKPSPTQPQLETIVTLARPATVISNPSTASSPAPSEAKMTKEERLSPRVSKPSQVQSKGPLLLPDRQDMDWSSLVDTATRAMLHADLEPTDSSSPREEELAKHISQLESRLSRETRRRLSLEEEVRGLREENRRLQQESQSAAQQLRRFTEWFFQTIDKQ